MGQNIGTCVTALLSSVGANRSARRAALVHLYFNVIGTVVFMVGFYSIHAIVPFGFVEDTAGPMGIAVIHSVFNVVATLLLLPFSRGLEKLAYLSIQETEEEKQQKEMGTLLDERFLEQPAFAMERCKKVAMTMAETAKQGFLDAMSLLDEYDEKTARKVYQKEEEVDHYEDELEQADIHTGKMSPMLLPNYARHEQR